MRRYGLARAVWPLRNKALHCNLIAAILVVVILVSYPVRQAISAEPITDRESCEMALSKAEAKIVGADIDSGTFRALNDQLVEMQSLCSQENFPGAETKLLAVMNVLEAPR